MSKRIEFIAPVESMRGSFSPKQRLLYAENNNPAFDAPVGRQYARNYQPTFIGAKRAASGLKYFACKTKSATLVTPASKLKMALTGGVGAIYAAILEAPTMRARLEYAWKSYFKSPKTFRAFMYVYLNDMLTRKATAVQIGRDSEGTIIVVGNPWNASSTASYIPAISEDVLVKFWMQLGSDSDGHSPIYFTVDGLKGIAVETMTWAQLTSNTVINVLNITNEGGDISIADAGTISYNGTAVDPTDAVVADRKYECI